MKVIGAAVLAWFAAEQEEARRRDNERMERHS